MRINASKKNNLLKSQAKILFISLSASFLLASLFTNCSNQFDSNIIVTDSVISQSKNFSELSLRNQLEGGAVTIDLAPVSGVEAANSAIGCTATTSIFSASYFGISPGNTIYGTVVDLCSDVAPKISVSRLSDGDKRIQVESSQLLPVDYILVQGVYRTVYLFHHKIADRGKTGLFWVTGHSGNDVNYALEIIAADKPIYYQATQGPPARAFRVRPRIVSPLNPFTIKSQQQLYPGSFCVLAVGTNLSYEWSKVGVTDNLMDTTRCLKLNPAQPIHSGSYRVRVFNTLGEVFSTAQLKVSETPPSFGTITPNAGVILRPPTPMPQPIPIVPALTMCVDVVATDSNLLNFTWEVELPAVGGTSSSGVKTVVKTGILPQGLRQECFEMAVLTLTDNFTKFHFKVSNTGGVFATEFTILVKEGVPVISSPVAAAVQVNVIETKGVSLNVDYLVIGASQANSKWELIPVGSTTKKVVASATETPPGTSSSYDLTNLNLSNDGDQYIFTISNIGGDSDSVTFTIAVDESHIPPDIVTPPLASRDIQSGVELGQALCFEVEGYPLTDYTIYKNGVEDTLSQLSMTSVPGFVRRIRACLELPGGATSLTQVVHSGLYRFEFRNDSTSINGKIDSDSTVATLTVLDEVQILDSSDGNFSLSDLTLAEGTSIGGNLSDEQFCVFAAGTDLEYAWARKDLGPDPMNPDPTALFVALPGQISSCLNIPSASPSDTGAYRVRVTNRLSGAITSPYKERMGTLIITTESDIAPGG